jgi:hypothetical protein
MEPAGCDATVAINPPGPSVGAAGRPLAPSGEAVPTRMEHLDAQVTVGRVPPP